MTKDAQGHRLSGATATAVTAYDQAVRTFNLVHGDAIGLFDTARQAAPELAMSHLGKAWVFTVANDPGRAPPRRSEPLCRRADSSPFLAAWVSSQILLARRYQSSPDTYHKTSLRRLMATSRSPDCEL